MPGCEKFEGDLIEYLDGTLEGVRLEALLAHLHSCAACSHRLEKMRILLDETAKLSVEMPDGLHERIMRRVERERRHGRLLHFTSRRTLAVAAAAVALVCTASVFGTLYARSLKGMDMAGNARMTAENSTSYFALHDDSAEDTGSMPMDGVCDAGKQEDVMEDSAEAYDAAPAELDAKNNAEQEAAEEEDTAGMEDELFSHFAADSRYASVSVMNAETVPTPLEAYLPQQEDTVADDTASEEVYYISVPAAELEDIIAACQAEDVKLVEHDTARLVPDDTVIDSTSERALIVLQIIK